MARTETPGEGLSQNNLVRSVVNPVTGGISLYGVTKVVNLVVGDESFASSNASEIQKALNGAGRVEINDAGVVWVNTSLILKSNTQLIVGPATQFKLAANANCLLLVNESASAAKVSCSLTAVRSVATLTKTAHGKSVGDAISVLGAAQHEYNGTWIVQSTPTADTLTYFCESVPVTPATGSPTISNADKNISVSGGIWDGNYTQQTTPDTTARMLIAFAHVFRPSVEGIHARNGSKYCFLFNDCSEVSASNLYTDFTSSDFFDLRGPIRGAVVRSLRIDNSSDDPVAVCNGDLPQYEFGRGEITRVSIEDVWAYANTTNIIKINGGAGPRIRQLSIKRVQGYSAGHCIDINNYTTGGATLTSTYVENLTVEDISAMSLIANGAVIRVSSNAVVDNFSVSSDFTPPLGGQNFLLVDAGAVVRRVTFSGMLDALAATSGVVSLVQTTATGVISHLDFRARVINATSSTYGILNNGTINYAGMHDCSWSGQGFLYRINTGAVTGVDVHLANSRTSNTNNPIDLRVGCNLYTTGWRHSGSTAVNLNGTGTFVWNGDIASTNAHLAIAGGMVANVNGPLIKVDVTTIGRLDGSQVYNTNAAAGTLGSAGPVVCQGTAANSWKLLANTTLTY